MNDSPIVFGLDSTPEAQRGWDDKATKLSADHRAKRKTWAHVFNLDGCRRWEYSDGRAELSFVSFAWSGFAQWRTSRGTSFREGRRDSQQETNSAFGREWGGPDRRSSPGIPPPIERVSTSHLDWQRINAGHNLVNFKAVLTEAGASAQPRAHPLKDGLALRGQWMVSGS